jgi:hypothetical protein
LRIELFDVELSLEPEKEEGRESGGNINYD